MAFSLLLLLLRGFFSFSSLPTPSQLLLLSIFAAVCILYSALILRRKWRHIFIVDFGCFNPPTSWRTPSAAFMEHSKLCEKFQEKSLEFQRKILERSGLSQLTALPTSLRYLPPRITTAEERCECETALFGAIDDLFKALQGRVRPDQVGVIVTNCSVFSPTPSMASMIVQKYKMPVYVKSFSLAGMGCAAGLLALDLAKRVLLAHPSKYALVLSTENLTRSWYYGNERSMLVTNCLFRVGASAVLLSNRWGDGRISKYRVMHTVRSHIGANDLAYRCVYQEEDAQGLIGVSLSKDLMYCASLALEHNLKMLGPKVLPLMEIILYLSKEFLRRLSHGKGSKPYIPKFKLAFDNICIHAGGKAVVQAMEKSLDLPLALSEPSYMTLHRYGNVSSASVWYELAYEEAKGRVKKGNRVWQIGLGSGFKCCCAVLKALKSMDAKEKGGSNCWADCIRNMPVPMAQEDEFAH